MSLLGEMRQHAIAHPDESESTLADTFLESHTKRELAPLFRDEFVHVRRGLTAAAEVSALMTDPPAQRDPVTRDDVTDRLGNLRQLLDERYRVGDGAMRRGGEMTLSDWETRRTMLLSQRNGIDRAVKACDRAIEVIREAGVGTLGEVASAAV